MINDQKCENCDILGPQNQNFANISSLPKILQWFFFGGGSKMRDKMAISAYIFEKSRKGLIFKVSNQS